MQLLKTYSLNCIVFILVLLPSAFGQDYWKDECARTENSKIYSNAFYSEEGGDVVGYELAIDQHSDLSADASLFMFEGAPSEGVHLHGHKLGNKIVLQGNWVEHLIEHPSNKEIVETHLVKIRGLITSELFDGKLNIEDMGPNENIRLKRVKRLWMCKQ